MITGIIMASGFSRRMGKDKLLMEVNGKKVIESIIEAAKYSNLDEVILVYRLREINDIAKSYDIKTIYNEKARLGQSQSVILGIENSKNNSYMFLVADQPFINHLIINKLIDCYRENKDKIIIPYVNNEINMPIIFPARFKQELLQIKGDKGGREIIRNNPRSIKMVNFDDGNFLKDIDTMEDYNKILSDYSKTII
ncbi:MAG: molybdenum cofactor cytidylyltransferase [Tissierellaceae bacterium]|nr:molybdenum cofactor cytidylyltransferase [Tissierellaceae bacterium]